MLSQRGGCPQLSNLSTSIEGELSFRSTDPFIAAQTLQTALTSGITKMTRNTALKYPFLAVEFHSLKSDTHS